MKEIILLSAILMPFFSLGQEFKTTFVITNNQGQDSVEIGFDIDASIGVDPQFGEIDISNTPFDSLLEIRVGQFDPVELHCPEPENWGNPDIVTYMSKIDIAGSRNCEGYDNTSTINGLVPISTFFINNKYLPITLSWDSTLFDNDCLESSLLTDIHPGVWFDVGGCGDNIVMLKNQNSIYIDNPSVIYTIDTFGDTLSLYHVAFGVSELIDGVNNLNHKPNNTFALSPNPVQDCFTLSKGQDYGDFRYQDISLDIIDNSGKKVLYRGQIDEGADIDVSHLAPNNYYVEIKQKGRLVQTIKMVIN